MLASALTSAKAPDRPNPRRPPSLGPGTRPRLSVAPFDEQRAPKDRVGQATSAAECPGWCTASGRSGRCSLGTLPKERDQGCGS